MEISSVDDLKSDGSQGGSGVTGTAVFLFVFGLFTALRFWHLSYYCLDGDEIFSLSVASADWSVMFPAILADLVHPPFSYIVLKLWIMIGGDGIFWLRMLPALLSMSAVVPFLLLCRELHISRAACSLSLYLIAVNGYLIYWAHDIRMYSLLLFLTLLSYWVFIRFSRETSDRWKHIVPLLAVNLVLVYTHYFGWFVVGVQFVYLSIFARSKVKQYFVAGCVWAAAFAPWAYAIKLAAAEKNGFDQNLGWIARPSFSALAWFYAMLNGDIEIPHTTLIGLAIFSIPIVILVARTLRKSDGPDHNDNGLWLLALAATLPVIAAFAASRILPQSVWGERHLIIAVVPYFILLAECTARLRPVLLRSIVIGTIVVWAGLAGFHKMAENNRPAWDRVTEQMLAAEPPGNEQVPLYTFEEVVDPIVGFHLARSGNTRFRVLNIKDPNALKGDHFWVLLRTPVGGSEAEIRDNMNRQGYRIGPAFSSETPLEKISMFPAWKER